MGVWSRAGELATQTPDARNRYVDFLRAVSILLVVFGHWFAAAPYIDADGEVTATHVLAFAPWSHWLSWALQIMPIFFMVGGFSNGISWSAALRSEKPYGEWLDGRLRRLVGPVLPLILVWILAGIGAHLCGVSPQRVSAASAMALIPIWFLAVYVMVVVLTPLSHALWRRFGMASFWAMVAAAVLMDTAFFNGFKGFGWSNYLFVWSAVHQLGYAWQEGRMTGTARTLCWALVGLITLVALVHLGPYPTSMVGVPGEDISNTTPPKIPLLALAALEAGLLLTFEAPLRRWLKRLVPWTATILINGMIMTIFLWHLTAMVAVIGVSVALGGSWLELEPGSGDWWSARPLWLAVLAIALIPFVLVMARFERPRIVAGAPVAPAWRQVVGALAVCFGLAFLALRGVAGDDLLGLDLKVVLAPFVGAALMRPWSRAAQVAS